ncbi:MAG: hypothetical protein A2V77_14990 [Anaeromyxobacter sp. RBG_16_69_14]|nr:MAG: hypothetical protein A2V77_14990 [Anaeromyxobacter sp. RBG_16_69_14]
MRSHFGWLLLLASIQEIPAALAAANGSGLVALALHAGASACAAGWLGRRLHGEVTGWSFALPFACALFVPLLGALGLAAVALGLPQRTAKEHPASTFVRTPVPRPPEAGSPRRAPSSSEPRQDSSARDGRVAALAAIRCRKDPASVALLWRALKDPEEEVRLFAFSLLESRTGAAYRRIHSEEQELAAATGARLRALHGRLAFEHWELAWLGLVQGEVLNHALERAEKHARAALEHEVTRSAASIHLLLGRIQLKRGHLDEARSALLRAGELGLPAPVWEPYLAEVAFRLRRFDLVRIHIDRAGSSGGNDPAARVQRYWL